jgi:hypothetical protein
MKLPGYIMTELTRRLGRDLPRRKFDAVLAATELSLEEPSPPPDFETMAETYGGDCLTGDFVLPAELKFLGHSANLHFRISYAGPPNDDVLRHFRGPAALLDLLVWDEDDPSQPSWLPVGLGILSDQMMTEIWACISYDASHEYDA